MPETAYRSLDAPPSQEKMDSRLGFLPSPWCFLQSVNPLHVSWVTTIAWWSFSFSLSWCWGKVPDLSLSEWFVMFHMARGMCSSVECHISTVHIRGKCPGGGIDNYLGIPYLSLQGRGASLWSSSLLPISVDLEGGVSVDSIPSGALGVKECVLVVTVPPPIVLSLEFSETTKPEFRLWGVP